MHNSSFFIIKSAVFPTEEEIDENPCPQYKKLCRLTTHRVGRDFRFENTEPLWTSLSIRSRLGGVHRLALAAPRRL